MRVGSKIWLESAGEKVFGDGPGEMLSKVDALGSLRQAAQEMNMSYSQAWNLITALEKRLGFPLLERSWGGSRLTPRARDLLLRYRRFRSKAESALERIFLEEFLNWQDS
ncbi:MAG: LysR family transcriptional regulator [Bacillota bacterium]